MKIELDNIEIMKRFVGRYDFDITNFFKTLSEFSNSKCVPIIFKGYCYGFEGLPKTVVVNTTNDFVLITMYHEYVSCKSKSSGCKFDYGTKKEQNKLRTNLIEFIDNNILDKSLAEAIKTSLTYIV